MTPSRQSDAMTYDELREQSVLVGLELDLAVRRLRLVRPRDTMAARRHKEDCERRLAEIQRRIAEVEQSWVSGESPMNARTSDAHARSAEHAEPGFPFVAPASGGTLGAAPAAPASSPRAIWL